MTNEQILTSYDFKLVTRAEFEVATDLPQGLLARALKYKGAFVVYDPLADDEGFLLVGNDREALAKETVEQNELEAH